MGFVYFFRGQSHHLESGHPDDAGLGVVGGAGRVVTLRRGARRFGHADDGTRAVQLVTVYRNCLLKAGIQTGPTGKRMMRKYGYNRL